MFSRVIRLALAGPLAAGSVIALSTVSAGAAKPTITAGPGSNLNCNITAKVKLSVPLKNDWIQSQHSSDPDSHVSAIPNTTFAGNGPEILNVKGSGTCSGTVTDGVNTASVTSVKFTLTNDPAHLGNTTEATCSSLVTGMPPSTAQYDTTLSWKSATANITQTTITGSVIPPASFSISGGTITGSFAGGTSNTNGVPDSTTVNAVVQGPASSTAPDPTFPQCQPALDIKTKKGVESATLDAPKGLKKVGIVAGSTLAISR